MKELADCCLKEAGKQLKRHRAVAVCEGCGRLLLAYGNDLDYERTLEELQRHDIDFSAGRSGALRVIAKERGSGP